MNIIYYSKKFIVVEKDNVLWFGKQFLLQVLNMAIIHSFVSLGFTSAIYR